MDNPISWNRFIEIVQDFSVDSANFATSIFNFLFTEIDDRYLLVGGHTPFELMFSTAIVGILVYRIVKFVVGIVTGS